jgi:universal stress protein E
MTVFRSILVALDVDDAAIADSGRAAVERALALARNDAANITFMHVLDVSDAVRAAMLSDAASTAGKRYAAIDRVLQDLAAGAAGVAARTAIVFGSHWREIVREVLRAGHDLVVIGTKRRGVAGRALFGSTGSKLLRTCPCPVWVAKAGDRTERPTVLVAHDLTAVGEAALDIGASVAALEGASVHVLHAIEHPEAERFLSMVDARTRAKRIEEVLEALGAQCRAYELTPPPQVSVAEGNAYAAILEHLRAHRVDLLVMGTVARAGVAALLTGNTAENVLPWVDCSLIAIKPAGFVSPVTLTSASAQGADAS